MVEIQKEEYRKYNIISMSIIANQLALHYNEEVYKLGSSIYKHKLKKWANLLIPELLIAEKKEFDKIEAVGEKISSKKTVEVMSCLEYLKQYGLNDFVFHTKVEMAANIDRNRIGGIVDKILKEEHQRINKELKSRENDK